MLRESGRAAPRGRSGVWALVFLVAPFVLATACTTRLCDTAKDTACDPTDADADGYIASSDCNDQNAAINPGAQEICDDTIDNDCDDFVDTGDVDCQ